MDSTLLRHRAVCAATARLLNMLINTIAYTPNALRDAVELDASDATCLPKSVMFYSPYLHVLHLKSFHKIQNGSSCKAALEFST